MAVLKFPPVLFLRASNPTAMFCCPYVFEYSEFFPIAVFLKPEVLDLRASSPIAVLLEPLVFAFKASSPIATLSSPEVKAGIPSEATETSAGNPTLSPAIKEYNDKLPACDALLPKIMEQVANHSILSLKNIKTRE